MARQPAAKKSASTKAPVKSVRAPTTIDEYLVRVSPSHREALEKIRQTVRNAVPDAEECISYGMPTFRLGGTAIFHFAAAAQHCAIYGSVPAALQQELARFDSSGKGTIRFQPEDPIPAAVLEQIVTTRVAALTTKKKARTAVK